METLDGNGGAAVMDSSGLFGFKPRPGKKPLLALISLYSFESLGIRYVASAVRQAGFECIEIFYEDFKRNTFRYPTQEELRPLIAILREKGADIVGLSVRSSYRRLAEVITREVHGELRLPVIWGSTHATIMPDDAITVCDAICRGDGEESVPELLRRLHAGEDISSVPGFWFKKPGGAVIKNEMAKYVDVNAIPDPQYGVGGKYFLRDGVWHDGDPQQYEGAFIAVSSRGCPHLCTFCSNHFYLKASPGYLRLRTVDRIIDEINRAREIMPHIKRVKFYDDLFAANKKWTDEFVEKYPARVGLPFDALLNPHQVSETLLAKLKKAGLTLVEMGIQSGAERISNEIYDRRLNNEKLIAATHILHNSGVRIHYDLIIDNPLETSDDKRANLELMLAIPRPYSLFILSLTYFPGTPLTERLLKEGKIAPADIEGSADKTLYQWEVSLTHSRPAEDVFWLALMSMLTKDFVPKGLIRFLSRRPFLMRHPAPLTALAWVANVVKLAGLAVTMYREGSLTWQMVRRHLNVRDLAVK